MSTEITTSDTAPTRKLQKRWPIPPGLLRAPEAASYCGIGKSTWERHSEAGLNPEPIRLGGAVLWDRRELAEWIRHRCPDRKTWSPIWAAIVARRDNRKK